MDDLPSFLVVAGSCLVLVPTAALAAGLRREAVASGTLLILAVLGPAIFGVGPQPLRSSVSYLLHFVKRSGVFTPEAKRKFDYDEIRPGLLVGRQPRHKGDLEQLKSEGVTAVVTLNEDWELFVPDLGERSTKLGMKHLQVPTADFQGPELQSTVQAVELVRQQLRAKGKVYIHCNAGRGRSAVVAAAYMLAEDSSADSEPAKEVLRVVKEMRLKRPAVTPNLMRYPITGQSRALRRFATEEAERLGAAWKKAS